MEARVGEEGRATKLGLERDVLKVEIELNNSGKEGGRPGSEIAK